MSDTKISDALLILEESLKEKGEEVKELLETKYANLNQIIKDNINGEFLPPASKRVEIHTSERAHNRIRLEMIDNIATYIDADENEIDERLEELDYESDIERILEINAASLMLFGLNMSFLNRRWLILPIAVSSFLLQHGLQGWCPPLTVLRNIGIRTRQEIDDERNVLKRIRGDFGEFQPSEGDPYQIATELLNTQSS